MIGLASQADEQRPGGASAGNGLDCCGNERSPNGQGGSNGQSLGRSIDWLLWLSLMAVTAGLGGHLLGGGPDWWRRYSHGEWELMSMAWWGILAGIVAVGIIGQFPKALVMRLLGRGGSFAGVLRATAAGTLLDLCNHGILMVGMQLYRKGASLGQTIAFLVSSPWNSLSLTLILIGLIGLSWTLAFIALSMLVGIVSGWLADRLVARGLLPGNPNQMEDAGQAQWHELWAELRSALRPDDNNLRRVARQAWRESRMILRWIFFGIALAGLIRAVVPDDAFAEYFGPSLVGLGLTLLAATVIEVCAEGSSPIAADLLNRAQAPGNAFTFLMAGAATDYTELLVLRQTTGTWRATLALPLLTTPQVLVIAWLLNGGSA